MNQQSKLFDLALDKVHNTLCDSRLKKIDKNKILKSLPNELVKKLLNKNFNSNYLKKWLYFADQVDSRCFYDDRTSCVCFSKDSNLIAVGKNDGKIEIYNFEFEKLEELNIHDNKINSINFSSDTNFLLTCSDDKSVKIYDFVAGKSKTLFRHNNLAIKLAKFSNDLKYMALLLGDNSFVFLDINNINFPVLINSKFCNYGEKIIKFDFDASGKYLVLLSDKNRIYFFDINLNRIVDIFNFDFEIKDFLVSLDLKIMALICFSSVELYDTIAKQSIYSYYEDLGQIKNIINLGFSDNDEKFYLEYQESLRSSSNYFIYDLKKNNNLTLISHYKRFKDSFIITSGLFFSFILILLLLDIPSKKNGTFFADMIHLILSNYIISILFYFFIFFHISIDYRISLDDKDLSAYPIGILDLVSREIKLQECVDIKELVLSPDRKSVVMLSNDGSCQMFSIKKILDKLVSSPNLGACFP